MAGGPGASSSSVTSCSTKPTTLRHLLPTRGACLSWSSFFFLPVFLLTLAFSPYHLRSYYVHYPNIFLGFDQSAMHSMLLEQGKPQNGRPRKACSKLRGSHCTIKSNAYEINGICELELRARQLVRRKLQCTSAKCPRSQSMGHCCAFNVGRKQDRHTNVWHATPEARARPAPSITFEWSALQDQGAPTGWSRMRSRLRLLERPMRAFRAWRARALLPRRINHCSYCSKTRVQTV